MKVLFQDYTFNASAKTITFNTTDTVRLENVLLITNLTDNIIIYNFADPTLGGTISNNVLTLTYNTATMSNTDSLQIYLDLYGTPATEETLTILKDQNDLLRRIIQVVNPLATQDSAQRQRVAVDSSVTIGSLPSVTIGSGTITTVSTVSTVTNVSQFGGVDPRFQFTDAARLTYAQGIRRNLQFS
jgi:hypothetical protein